MASYLPKWVARDNLSELHLALASLLHLLYTKACPTLITSMGQKKNPSMAPKSCIKSTLPSINWATDDSALIWGLIAEMEKKENAKVLFGKEKTEVSTHAWAWVMHLITQEHRNRTRLVITKAKCTSRLHRLCCR